MKIFTPLIWLLKFLMSALCLALTGAVLLLFLTSGTPTGMTADTADADLFAAFESHWAQVLTQTEESLLHTPKRFWIPENSPIPKRNDSCYGTARSASELQWLIDEAQVLLEGKELLFNTDIEIYRNTQIHYYLDESLFAVCWQQVFDRVVYTIAEVKISHPSQFRRYFSDDVYGTGRLKKTTDLAAQVGAVVASSADHHRGRQFGIVIKDGQVMRFAGAERVDTCFVDENGDFLLAHGGTFKTQTELEEYIGEHGIDFCFSFGPILIKDGIKCYPQRYVLGEINDGYPRCAVAQKDKLHYLLITVNGNGGNFHYPKISALADQIEKMGVQQAYTLDGGATGAIVLHDDLMNPNEYTLGQRLVADIFYFATAVPNTEKTGS